MWTNVPEVHCITCRIDTVQEAIIQPGNNTAAWLISILINVNYYKVTRWYNKVGYSEHSIAK